MAWSAPGGKPGQPRLRQRRRSRPCRIDVELADGIVAEIDDEQRRADEEGLVRMRVILPVEFRTAAGKLHQRDLAVEAAIGGEPLQAERIGRVVGEDQQRPRGIDRQVTGLGAAAFFSPMVSALSPVIRHAWISPSMPARDVP